MVNADRHPPGAGKRRLPPYGARLREILAAPSTWPRFSGTSPDGRHLTLWVIYGADAWSTARRWAAEDRRLFVVLPPDEAPSLFDWSILAGHSPVLLHRCGIASREALMALAAAMLRDGVERVLCAESGALFTSERRAAA